jgi:hypothetical protein
MCGAKCGVFNMNKWHIYSPLYLGASMSSTIHSKRDSLMVDVLGYKREEGTRGVIMRGFTNCLFSKHMYFWGDKMEEDERDWKCSTRGTCKLHADIVRKS